MSHGVSVRGVVYRLMAGLCLLLPAISTNASSPNFPTAFVTPTQIFDRFGDITCEDELARLDNLAIELQSAPAQHAYIIVYGSSRGRRNEARARLARMKFYLVKRRGVDATRITTINGGYRENLECEFWLMPSDAPAPSPQPTVSPHDVKLKGRMRVRGYDCGANLG